VHQSKSLPPSEGLLLNIKKVHQQVSHHQRDRKTLPQMLAVWERMPSRSSWNDEESIFRKLFRLCTNFIAKKNRETPLHNAAMHDDAELVRALLSAEDPELAFTIMP